MKQYFVKSEDELKQKIYIFPPNGQNFLEIIEASPGSLLKVFKPLSGMPEFPGYWWSTMQNHHFTILGMKQSVIDRCLFFKVDDRTLSGVQGTIVDDMIATESDSFVALEDDATKRFECKAKS